MVENQKVQISFNIGSQEQELFCRIKSFDNDRISLIYPDETVDYAQYLQEGEDIKVKIFTPLGVTVYDAVVIDSPLEDEFVIEYVEDSKQIQRREYIRLPYEAKILLEVPNSKPIIAKTLDLSAGGLKFFSESFFDDGEEATVTIYFDDARFIKAKGIIVAPEGFPENHYAITFTDIDERDRDRIIKKCFDIQLENQGKL